jgi:hypothetical protein
MYTPVLLSAAIVEELKLNVHYSTTIVILSNLSVFFISKFNSIYYSVTVTRCYSYSCFVLLKMGDSDARNM